MSSSLEYNSAEIFSDEEVQIEEQPSQIIPEHNSTLRNFHSLYFLKWNFKGPLDTLAFINKQFHLTRIQDNIQSFPDLAQDPIYNYTYINNYLFPSLQRCIQQSIVEH